MGLVNGRGDFHPPQLQTLRSIFMKLEIYNYLQDDPTCKISGAYVDVGGLGK